MSYVHVLSPEGLSLAQLQQLLEPGARLELGEAAKTRIEASFRYLQEKIAHSDAPIYGINTGFGSLYKEQIARQDLEQLQVNLVMSHACGTGPELPAGLVRLMLILKVQSLLYGHSAVQLATVERLISFFNRGVLPVVFEQGSLGASGDLAPLAHLCLPLLGLGKVRFEGYEMEAAEVNQLFGWEPITLKAKEGLALLNGTQFMSAYGSWCLLQADRLSYLADAIGAVSLEAFDGRPEPFDELLHVIRPHQGQLQTARHFRELLQGSELISQYKKHVQDPYSFRCIPQVHGASKDAIAYASQVFTTEINSVTDNPNVFPEQDKILSGGNFHGQPLALALDFLGLALAELGNISERRTYQLISGQRGLPEFLVANPGLNSGFMIPQYTAASIVSQNKQLCSPASADSIVSSNGQEDHVSMGANAATKTYRIVQNLERILAIELFTAAQALDFRLPVRTSPTLSRLVQQFRESVSFVEQDRVMHTDITAAVRFVQTVRLPL